ncbi:hypothetical protein BJV78DRAFT_1153821 [Lactifluus subvellereus]|nr:hypothetical protein BJV78DRAFT_1153821 [Lactifluus subvellereus]
MHKDTSCQRKPEDGSGKPNYLSRLKSDPVFLQTKTRAKLMTADAKRRNEAKSDSGNNNGGGTIFEYLQPKGVDGFVDNAGATQAYCEVSLPHTESRLSSPTRMRRHGAGAIQCNNSGQSASSPVPDGIIVRRGGWSVWRLGVVTAWLVRRKRAGKNMDRAGFKSQLYNQ